MSRNDKKDTRQSDKPDRPPLDVKALITPEYVSRLKRMAELGRRDQARAEKALPRQPSAPQPRRSKPQSGNPPVIDIDADPQNANWLRILAAERQQRQQEQQSSPAQESTTTMADDLSSRPWDGGAENYPDASSYCAACLVDTNEPGKPKIKANCHLPVAEPGGAYNRAALGAAAAALAGARGGGVQLPPALKKSAARKLVNLYARFNLPIPPSLKSMAS